MKNVKYTFRYTEREDYSIQENNYNAESEYVVCEPPFNFGDYIGDYLEYQYEQVDDKYYILNSEGERTGECFWLIGEEETDEEI